MVSGELIRNSVAHRAVIDGLPLMRFAANQRGSWGMFFAGVQGVPHRSTIMRPALAQQPTFRWSPVDFFRVGRLTTTLSHNTPFDDTHGFHVFRSRGGEYVLILMDYLHKKNLRYRWSP